MKVVKGKVVVYFDGVCNLCNGLVDFLIKRDKKRIFKYASLQSPEGESLLSDLDISKENALSTVIVIDNDRLLIKSRAAIHILSHLGGGWKWVAGFLKIFPKSFSDWVYDRVASSRYRLMGKRNHCRVPTPEEADLFL